MKSFLFRMAAVVAVVFAASCSQATTSTTPAPTPKPAPTPVLDYSYASDNGSPYIEGGTAGTNNGTIQTQAGSPGLYINMPTVTQWGSTYICFEEPLTAATDFSAEDYVVSFDLWLPAGSPVTVVQYEILNDSYAGFYSKNYLPSPDTSAKDGAWHSYTMGVASTDVDYDGTGGDWTARTKARLQFKTANTGEVVVACVKNFKIVKK